MERDGDDAAAAATHDFRFHEELVRHCDNEQLLGTLRPLKRRLLRYELAYMAVPRNVGDSVSQHAEILDALDRDDREAAAVAVESNFRDAMPRMLEHLVLGLTAPAPRGFTSRGPGHGAGEFAPRTSGRP